MRIFGKMAQTSDAIYTYCVQANARYGYLITDRELVGSGFSGFPSQETCSKVILTLRRVPRLAGPHLKRPLLTPKSRW